jgi:type II secretory pathway component PulF
VSTTAAPTSHVPPDLQSTRAGTVVLRIVLVVLLLIVATVVLRGAPAWGLPLLAVVVATVIWRMRRRRAMAVLRHLDHALARQAPIPPTLAAAARDEPTPIGLRLLRLGDAIGAGTGVARALAFSVPEMPSRVLGLIAAGEHTGRLRDAVCHVLRLEQRRDADTPPEYGLGGGYLGLIALLLGLYAATLGIAMTRITPKFMAIFSDFNVAVPAAMRWMAEYGPWIGVPLLLLAAVFGVIFPLFLLVAAPIASARWADGLGWVIAPAVWVIPPLRRMARDRALADGAFAISQSLAAGVPMHLALGQATALDVNHYMRKRFERWTERVAAGEDLAASARAAGMPSLVSGMLGTAMTGETARHTFDFLTEYYSDRYGRLAKLLRGAVVPVTVLLFGGLVGLFAWTILDVIAHLIHSVGA